MHNGEEAVRTKNLPNEKPDIRPTPMPTPKVTPSPSPTPVIGDEFEIYDGMITGYHGSGGDLVIPAIYKGQTVKGIYRTAFRGNTAITSVTIPATVINVDQRAFEGCTNIEKVVLKEGITELFHLMFAGCTSLRTVSVPDSIRTVSGAFRDCTALTELRLGENVEIIYHGSFEGCTNLEKLTITSADTTFNDLFGDYGATNGKLTIYGYTGSTAEEYARQNGIPFVAIGAVPTPEPTPTPTPAPEFEVNSDGVLTKYNGNDADVVIPENTDGITVTAVGANAFHDNTDIVSVSFPDTVKSIKRSAFGGCTSLKRIDTNKVEIIEETAFYGCTDLKEVIFREDMKSIGMRSFIECDSLEKITVMNRNLSIEGYIWPDNGIMSIYGYLGSDAEYFAHMRDIPFYDIETGKRVIKEWIIDEEGTIRKYNGSGTDITIPETVDGTEVTAIGSGVFEENTEIVSVTLPEKAAKIYVGAFWGCTSLETVNTENVTYLGSDVFYGCSSLRELVLNAGVSIGHGAFEGCTGFEKITVFGRDTYLDVINNGKISVYGYVGSAAQCSALMRDIPFYDIETGEKTEREFVTDPSDGTIMRYKGTDTEIVIPDAVDGIEIGGIGVGAFAGSDIISVTMPDNVKFIYPDAFDHCVNLKKVSLSLNMTSLPTAFAGCESLEYIRIPASITDIWDDVFADCPNLVIYGAAGSAAWEYARANNIPFVIDETLPTPVPATPTPEPTDTPKPYTYPYRVISCSLTAHPGYAMVAGKCYNKKENAALIFAVYDEDGALGSVRIKSINAGDGKSFAESFPYTDGRFSIFVWNMNTQEPYSQAYDQK
ncbi:MAG: leucine-rich repeat domain-containing protein [Oscillospiraceae bacterium]|nr:leucine-rich repeat domain-containing protein [Oscillospiraceae bacterium]